MISRRRWTPAQRHRGLKKALNREACEVLLLEPHNDALIDFRFTQIDNGTGKHMMKNIAKTTLLALLLGTGAFAAAGHHSGAEHGGDEVKHVGYSELGDPASVLKVKSETSRALGQGEVRVTVLAAPINPSDLLQISGNYGVDPVLPARPGSEGVGRVVEVSPDVQALKVGQLVLLATGSTWAEELVAPAAGFLPLPDLGPIGADVIEQLAMSTVNPLTALLMLTSFTDVAEGQWIAQSAANSAVGGLCHSVGKAARYQNSQHCSTRGPG
jgi:hypothetical protein